MLNNSTNIQDLYETLIKEKKKVLLFGAGSHALLWVNQINRYIWYLCDDWKTPNYISEEAEYPYSYIALEEFVDCFIDNDKRKHWKELNGRMFRVRSAEYLEEIVPEDYILIIVTDQYEEEVKEQLRKIDNIKNMPCYSFMSNMHYYRKHSRGLIVDRMIIPYMQSVERYAYLELFLEDEYDKIKTLIEQGEYVANGVAFQITTICNLKCKYCVDYVPKIEHRNMDLNKILNDIDTFFGVAARCLYVELSTAEVLLCPNLKVILEKLLPMDAVQHIQIITNGVTYPKDEKVLQLLANPKVRIHMSNYNMPEKTDISRKVYEEHGIKVDFPESQMWIINGIEPYNHNLSHEALSNCYMTCKENGVCPQEIAEGRLTRCGRIQRFVEVSDFDTEHDYIDFDKYQTKEELKQALINLELENYMDGCAWCPVPLQKSSDIIPPAEQLL